MTLHCKQNPHGLVFLTIKNRTFKSYINIFIVKRNMNKEMVLNFYLCTRTWRWQKRNPKPNKSSPNKKQTNTQQKTRLTRPFTNYRIFLNPELTLCHASESVKLCQWFINKLMFLLIISSCQQIFTPLPIDHLALV